MEKVYPIGPYRKEMIKKLVIGFSAIVVMWGIPLFLAFISETLFRTAPNWLVLILFPLVLSGLAWMFALELVFASPLIWIPTVMAYIMALILTVVLVRRYRTIEIVFTDEGIFFKSRLRPVTIQKITDLEVVKFLKKERNLKIVGLTPDGKEVRRSIVKIGNVGKRWEEFKEDLQKISSR